MIKPINILRTILLFLITCIGLQMPAQNVNNEIQFTNHLLQQQYYEECIFEAQRIKQSPLTPGQIDTLNYLSGWAAYNLKKLELSATYLKQVSESSTFFNKSRLFAIYNELHLMHYDSAQTMLYNFNAPKGPPEYFKQYLQAGCQLLQRDVVACKSTFSLLPDNYYGYASELPILKQIADEMQSKHNKSPLLACFMSAVIPGSGKIYAGKSGQGIMAFLITSGLGLVTIENYNKRGIDQFETILFGSALTVFYVGNIYGSAFSVKLANDENYELQNKRILFNLHIPLRNIFD